MTHVQETALNKHFLRARRNMARARRDAGSMSASPAGRSTTLQQPRFFFFTPMTRPRMAQTRFCAKKFPP